MLKFPVLLASLALATSPALAQEAPPNPQIDYDAFNALTQELSSVRAAHRLAWPEFAKRARARGAILLDARSATAFARGHIRGAINLPFTDFTAESLQGVLGDNPERPVFIYCNNNFIDDRAPVALKAAPLALNIPTFINLHGYGYKNIWELADRIATSDFDVHWVTGAAR